MAKQQIQSASAKLVSGVGAKKSSDVLTEVAKEVETLSQKKAFELVDELIAEGGISDFKLGGVLAVISDKAKSEGGQEWLEGHATFKELCDARFGIHYRKAMYLIDIYKALVGEGIDWNQVKSLGWTKIATLCEFKVLTAKSVDKWVAKAEKLTVMQLRDALKSGGDSSDKPATMTFKVHESQKEAIREALEKGKKQLNTDVDTVALHGIMQGYLGNAVTIDVEGALEEKPKGKKLQEYWAERLKTAFNEVTKDLGDGDTGGPGMILRVFEEEFPKVTVNVVFTE